MDIGKRLKAYRNINQMTQDELGHRTNLSKSYISQLENNKVQATVECFLHILSVLDVSPSEFFNSENDEQIIHKHNDQTIVNEDGITMRWPIKQSNAMEMEPIIITLEPGASMKKFKPSKAETFIYIQQGHCTLKIGEHQYVANQHDAMYFKSNASHQIINTSDDITTFTMVMTHSSI